MRADAEGYELLDAAEVIRVRRVLNHARGTRIAVAWISSISSSRCAGAQARPAQVAAGVWFDARQTVELPVHRPGRHAHARRRRPVDREWLRAARARRP